MADDGWTPEQLALFGTDTDEAVAAQIGRTAEAVRVMRIRCGIPSGHGWTADQLALLGTMPDDEVAARTGRTLTAVWQKRHQLGIPCTYDRRRREHRKERKG